MARSLHKRRLEMLEAALNPRHPRHNRFDEWTIDEVRTLCREGPHERVLDWLAFDIKKRGLVKVRRGNFDPRD